MTIQNGAAGGGRPAVPSEGMKWLTRHHDWAATSLGRRESWSPELRVTVDLILSSGHAMCVIWGPERVLLYNDAYAPILGARHPSALGKPTAAVWPELWDDLAPLIDRTFAGESFVFRDQPLLMTRNGFEEETWYDFAYSPVCDERDEVVGLLNVTSDSTARVTAGRDLGAAANKLSANEAKWRGLFETLEEGFILGEVVRDETGRIVDWRYDEVNDAWYDLVGIERGCAVGRTVREVFPGIEDEWVMEVARVVETGEAIHFTRQVGELQRWYDGVCQPAGDDRFTVLFLEVTDRVQAGRRREALAELGRVLPPINEPDALIHAATATIGQTLGVGRVGYGTVAEDGETFVVPADWTIEGYPTLAGTYRMDDYGGYAEDLRQGRIVVIPDIRLDPRTSINTAPLEAVAVRSLVNVPIVEKGRTVAILYINDDQPRDWAAEDLAFITDAGNRTRTALERRRAEEEAQRAATFMQSVLSASTDCIKVLDLDGKLTFMSEGGQKVMEVSDFNAIAGCPWPDFWQGKGNEEAVAALEAARQGEAKSFIGKADTMMGTPKWWHVAVSPIFGGDGKPARILSVSRDISELRASEEDRDRFKRLAENSTDFIAMAHHDGSVFYLNDAGKRMVGLEGTQPPYDMANFFSAEDAARNADEVLPAVQREGQWTGEIDFRNFKTGEVIPTLHSVFSIEDTLGNRSGYGTVTRDFRDHKQAEEQQKLLTGELAHRLKNMFSVVQAIAFQTLGPGESREEVSNFNARLKALADAQDVLTRESWTAASLSKIAIGVLATFDQGDRIKLAGPEITIGPRAALALSLLLHELATNAVKYGALSVTTGNIRLVWSLEEEDGKQVVTMSWVERGGPPAVQPTRHGFGSRIIRMGLTGSGGVDLFYGEQGFAAQMTAPFDQLQQA